MTTEDDPYLPCDLVPLTDDQWAIVRLCREFAAEHIRPMGARVDQAEHEVPWELWRRATDVGITGYMLPQAYGGGGVSDLFTQCLVQEELCVGDLGIGNLLTSAGFYSSALMTLGTDSQKERWLTPLCGPSAPLTALAVTEPGVGSDAAGITSRAVRVEGGYLLNGEKTWITNGGTAEQYIVFATVDPALRARGVTAFLLSRSTPGVSFGAPIPKMGQRAMANCSIHLDEVFVPDEDVLGAPGQGFAGLMRTFEAARILLGAGATGLARAATEYACAYAGQREQFGKPIREHQAVSFRLADMATRVEASRLLVWRAARRFDAGLPCGRQASMAKVFASESATWVALQAMQTLGGYGYSREFPVEQWVRDAKLAEIEEGTSDIQRLIIGRSLADDGGRP